jgi:hypothetical protein
VKVDPGNPRAVWGTLNSIGAMHGNKETPKGRAMERKHVADVKAGKAEGMKPKGHPGSNLGRFLHPPKKSR